ncbi:MAG: YggS family pyridoxal phosphate-dependent enzyme [Bacteroidales bacterium]|nr:YggS family pyridoxal phosphate-dependent enzyme [Bacteroidales bacterium]
MSDIAKAIEEIRAELPQGVTLIAVSKTHSADCVREAYDIGVRDFGENKVQEMVQKAAELPTDIRWHLIGHLQTNKVKYIAPFVYAIHSVDSQKLAAVINKEALKAQRRIRCLLQVHVAQEETKTGFTPEELLAYLESGEWKTLAGVEIVGIMAMATNTDDEAQVLKEFQSVRSLFDDVKLRYFPTEDSFREVCMGMSGDYKIAVQAGATEVRIGTKIFGMRYYPQKEQ